MLGKELIRNFYRNGFKEDPIHRIWPRLWNKHFRFETRAGYFIKANRFQDCLNFKTLRRLCRNYAHPHLYMSVLNWLMPERVGEKRKAKHAYPIGGEYARAQAMKLRFLKKGMVVSFFFASSRVL